MIVTFRNVRLNLPLMPFWRNPGSVLLLILLIPSCRKDTLHWQKVWQLNSGTTSKLNHLRFLNDSTCLIGGGVHYESAEVVRSVDGGYTWQVTSYPQAGKGLYGFGISPNGTVYLCGTDGVVLHSADNGSTFQFNRIGDWEYYVGGTFITPDSGIFISSHLNDHCSITQVDSNFTITDKQEFNFGLSDIYIPNPVIGYAVGYGAVMKTTDGRRTWHFQEPTDDKFMAMDIHGDEIWMCGYAGCVYHTLDGGEHWQRQRNGNDIALIHYRMLDIKFKTSLNGWAVCDDGKVVYTDDGGYHWMEYDQFTTNALRSLAFCPNGDLLVCGDNGGLFRLTTN